ncbi:hypothetical protein FQN57_002342 [Myotisia sp. PD_48]|nr:hypothetical protein FQN57_002342 [Myotisia sp. PD_48]
MRRSSAWNGNRHLREEAPALLNRLNTLIMTFVLKRMGKKQNMIVFGKDHDTSTELRSWRNNLTALSQRRNLYFVGHADLVHVYQPGPKQSLSGALALVLKPTIVDYHRSGSVSDYALTINHLIVGDLGLDEILLLCTDSGNVCAYRTELIYEVIQRYQSEAIDPLTLGTKVNSFFAQSVAISAWGLAIHKAARMIAVSSNSRIITVFAFALSSNPKQVSTEFELMEKTFPGLSTPKDWVYIHHTKFSTLQNKSRKYTRTHNFRFCLSGHRNNIPNISFLNCDLDPYGDWLVSVDIDKRLLLWKIWERSTSVNQWEFRPVSDDNQLADRHYGWNVLALDPRIFRMKSNIQAACGGIPHKYPSPNSPYDISFLTGRVRDASQYYHQAAMVPADNADSGPLPQGPPEDEEFPLADSDAMWSTPSPSGLEYDAGDENQNEGKEEVQPRGQDDTYHSNVTSGLDSSGLFPPTSQTFEPFNEAELDPTSSSYTEAELKAALAPPDGKPTPSKRQRNQESNFPPPETPFQGFPILHFSAIHVRMIPHPLARGPSVICHAPLSQVMTESYSWLNHYDRMSIVHQIPELGIVVAASQKGRVAIIGLTYSPEGGKMFRIERILPFASQEMANLRPSEPLVGVAVGPVEGHLLPQENSSHDDSSSQNSSSSCGDASNDERPETNSSSPWVKQVAEREWWRGNEYSRRYRLILMYGDNSTLRYELYYNWPKDAMGSQGQVYYDKSQPFVLKP